MKLSIPKAALNETLARLLGVAEKRVTVPILANILLDVPEAEKPAEGKIRLGATDMDMEISEWLPAHVKRHGTITVPAHTLAQICKKIGSDLVEITRKEDRIEITGGGAKFVLGTLPAEDFPELQDEKAAECHIRMDSEEFRKMLDAVKGAQSKEETRYYLCGVHLHSSSENPDNEIIAVATDGHRLAYCSSPIIDITGDLPPVIIPSKAVTEMRRIVDKPAGEIELVICAARAQLRCGNVTMKTKLIDGMFPDYARIVPLETAETIRFEVATVPFREAVERVGTVLDKSNGVKLSFSDGKLGLHVNGVDIGQADDEIDCTGAGKIDIGFNAHFLAEMTGHFPGAFTIAMTDPASAAKITAEDNPDIYYVLMPMRV